MEHILDLKNVTPKNIYDLGEGFTGSNPKGETISFTNYYMQVDGKPFYGVCGEFHYSRYAADAWEDEILKMKSGGVNIVSSYIFWIHHEETEGVFDFDGRRNLRRFVELCGKHGLYVIVRIGPFNHGEVRNGGLPDWLYGKPFDSRTTAPGFLQCTKRLYQQLHVQLNGLYYKQGGPIIGAQVDNEYMHSSAPWEITTGISDEWISPGDEGDRYMLTLWEMAKSIGIDVPFYTCTGWGGASTPQQLLPLWGGYSFRPWIFYSHKGEHPATEEYIYRDNHNNEVPTTYNFEPFYAPESKPYLCCEMGGGMFSSYNYRFQLPFESVDAMANIKLGSGCNMLGYYMYHGGTNPTGKTTPFLNESQAPKLSYDFQAPLGEFGQVRASYHRLRALHYLTQTFSETLCTAKTVLPDNSQNIQPEDKTTLRYAVRLAPDGGGFLFLNNYQDHAEMTDKQEETIRLELPGKTLNINSISLSAGENCILPFNLPIAGIPLEYATAQPLTLIENGGVPTAFFFAPAGMRPTYRFGESVRLTEGDAMEEKGLICPVPGGLFTVTDGQTSLRVVTLSREDSLRFYRADLDGKQLALLSDAAMLNSNNTLKLEYDTACAKLAVYPADGLAQRKPDCEEDGIWGSYTFAHEPAALELEMEKTGNSRYIVNTPTIPSDAKDVILQIHYTGDIGQAFIGGKMISDNFANGAPWQLGLKEHADNLKYSPLTLYIAPIRKGSNVNVASVMAGRKEESEENIALIEKVEAGFVYQTAP